MTFAIKGRAQLHYKEVPDLEYNSVAQRPDIKSAFKVVMVLNTKCFQYLWVTMWFHTKKTKETFKSSKSLILLCKFCFQPHIWPEIAKKKNGILNRDLLNFCIGMVYFALYQVNPHVQAVQNMSGKGDRVRGGRSLPYFQKTRSSKDEW